MKELHVYFSSLLDYLPDYLPATIAIFYAVAYLYIIFYTRGKRRKKESEFKILEKKLTNGEITKPSADLLQDIFCGMRDKSELSPSDKNDLCTHLKKFIEFHCNRRDIISPIIGDIKIADPYAELPAEERRVILEISQQIQNQNIPDAQSMLNKVDYIASLIAVRDDEMERLVDKSARYTRIGVILTTLFGVFTVIQLILALSPILEDNLAQAAKSQAGAVDVAK